MCLEVDLQKAFDTINREFVYHMDALGFSYKWINWVKECLATPTFSIMLNGSPAGYFSSSRGIRQGDPLGPHISLY